MRDDEVDCEGVPVIASRTSRVQVERVLSGDDGGHHRRHGVRMAM
jgi:hypothetical protein